MLNRDVLRLFCISIVANISVRLLSVNSIDIHNVKSRQSWGDQKYGNIDCTVFRNRLKYAFYAPFCKSDQKPKSGYILARTGFSPDMQKWPVFGRSWNPVQPCLIPYTPTHWNHHLVIAVDK